MITVSHLTRHYTMDGLTVSALEDVSFHIDQGEYAAIVGPSGSGKSTLMHLLGCLDTPTSGTYLLAGEDVSRLPEKELARVRGERIGFVFQGFQLIPRLTALENAALPLVLCGMPEKQRIARARKLLEQVGLAERMHHKPHQLSGGQQQRVAIARALSRNPDVLLADEPTGSLDPDATEDVLSLLGQMHKEGRTVLLITHDMHLAAQADRQLYISDGGLQSDSWRKKVDSSSHM